MGRFLQGPAIMVVDWIMYGLAFILVSIRLWFRLLYQRVRLRLSDILLIISLFFALGLEICLTITFQRGGMVEEVAMIGPTPNRKISYTSSFLYYTSVYCAKFSLLTLYYFLIPRTWPNLRTALIVTIVYTAGSYLTTLFLSLFWCGTNILSNFIPSLTTCSIYNHTYFNTVWSLNITSDFMAFVLPFPMLVELQLARRQVVALAITFGLGIITMAVSTGRFVAVKNYSIMPLFVWSSAECTTAIMVASLPALRPLLKRATKSTRRTTDELGATEMANHHTTKRAVQSHASVRSTDSAYSMTRQHNRHSFGALSKGWVQMRDDLSNGSDLKLESPRTAALPMDSRRGTEEFELSGPSDTETTEGRHPVQARNVFEERHQVVIHGPENTINRSSSWRRI
ncbi:hypothetical protein P152DRAFT_513888 [Eremomyces bilateralis CBS 781.70]|uniref:Rhodopsin domain-containing protein n=1 Tax=Eremomyces bilateralis CBS 781.70 TaxID=1392243 RepID=A0A6G1G4B0_9PEZI|nr:uncharacterized protein P152DRAFT_513888 [Eremomyces bilateralis CBS 781.70]KAF1812858.1 hypothetical protein P152DRAFT_513888 [Eremomyces bilateralis CBS 781.70]